MLGSQGGRTDGQWAEKFLDPGLGERPAALRWVCPGLRGTGPAEPPLCARRLLPHDVGGGRGGAGRGVPGQLSAVLGAGGVAAGPELLPQPALPQGDGPPPVRCAIGAASVAVVGVMCGSACVCGLVAKHSAGVHFFCSLNWR